jgi:hypothetical protein
VLHRVLVEDPGDAGQLLPAEEEVRDDVEVVAEREVLVDRRDAQLVGVLRVADADALALHGDRSRVRRLHARDSLDQRRLAGAVVVDEGDHLARVELETVGGKPRMS